MTLAGIFGLGGYEIILIVTLIVILFGAKKLPELGRGFGEGIKEFMKATHEVTDEIEEAINGERPPKREHVSHPFLMVLTLMLGTLCLILVLYEISK